MRKKTPKPSPASPVEKTQTLGAEGWSRFFRKEAPQLYKACEDLGSIVVSLAKSMGQEAGSSVGEEPGERSLPFDFTAAARFKIHNVHHSTCIRAKTRALVGMGHVLPEDDSPTVFPEVDMKTGFAAPPKRKRPKFRVSKAAEVLDPLCRHSWLHTKLQLAEDWCQVGNAYLEVVYRDNQIAGLHWIPAGDVRIHVEDRAGANYHFVVKGRLGGDVRMAPFGQRALLATKKEVIERFGGTIVDSEILHLPEPTTLDRWYGVPQWIAASPLIELVQAMHQHQFDWHVNRGVPEFLMLFLGAKIDKKTWGQIGETFDSWVGLGNQHKASAFNLPSPDLKVQLEKLAMEGVENGTFFQAVSEALSTMIVSAHGVPPSLAGILIPGKMGASNEANNALLTFQTLEIGPTQTLIETLLGARLGDPKLNAGLGLTREDFELRTIIEEMAEAMEMMKPVDTMGRMKQELPQAVAEGRNLNSGVKKSAAEILAETMTRIAKGDD